MKKRYKKVCGILNYFENLIILASPVTRCVSISDFTCFVSIPLGITSSPGFKICATASEIKRYESKI